MGDDVADEEQDVNDVAKVWGVQWHHHCRTKVVLSLLVQMEDCLTDRSTDSYLYSFIPFDLGLTAIILSLFVVDPRSSQHRFSFPCKLLIGFIY